MNGGVLRGGALFSAIGEDFRNLERSREVISADVLDAWFDPAEAVLARIREYLPFLTRTSPPVHAEGLVSAIADTRGVPRESVLAGAGASALMFHCLPRLIQPEQTVIRLDPMHGGYEHLCDALIGANVIQHRLAQECGFAVDGEELGKLCTQFDADALLIVNPNNPTGRLWPRSRMTALLDKIPDSTLVVVDETYMEYAAAGMSIPAAESIEREESLEKEAARRPNLIVLKSMSKVYALSGLRIGYLVGPAELVAGLLPFQPPWPVSMLGQVAAVEALRNVPYYEEKWSQTRRLREEFSLGLGGIAGVKPHPSEANWLLVELESPLRAAAALRANGIFVRDLSSMGPPLAERFLRIAVKTPEENERIARALAAAV